MTITIIIIFQKDCSPLPDRQVFLVQRGEGGRLGRTEAPTEYDSHDNIIEYYSQDNIVEYDSQDNIVEYDSHDDIIEYYSQDNMMMITMRITFQNDPEEDESDGDREDDYDDYMMIMMMIWWMTIETCLFPIRSSTVGPGLAGAYEMSNHQMVSITNPHRPDLRTSQS